MELQITHWYESTSIIELEHEGEVLSRLESEDKDEHTSFLWGFRSKNKGKGYGTMLLNKLEEHLLSKGKRTIELYVEEDNKLAIKLYTRLGYKIDKTHNVCNGCSATSCILLATKYIAPITIGLT